MVAILQSALGFQVQNHAHLTVPESTREFTTSVEKQLLLQLPALKSLTLMLV